LLLVTAAIIFNSCRKDEKSGGGASPVSTPAKAAKKFADVALPATGLIAYWPLNNSGIDVSGDNLNGSLHNVSSTSDRFGNAVGAYHFDGSTSYISVPNNKALDLDSTDFTLSAWIKLDAYTTSNGSVIYGKRTVPPTTGHPGYDFSITGTDGGATIPGRLTFGPGGTNGNITTTDTLGRGTWYMVSAVYSYTPGSGTGTLSLYINGVFKKDTTMITPNAPSSSFYIGRDDTTNTQNYFFQGSMSNLYVFNSALSASTLTALYNNTTSTTLLAYWPFDDSGNDLSGNSNNGTIHNVSSATDRFGNTVGAYHFDGSSSYVSVPDNTALRLNNTDFTLNSWVKMDSYNSALGSLIMSKSTTAGAGWLLAIVGSGASPATAGTVDYSLGYGGTSVIGVTAVPLNTWHMVTTVYKLSTGTLSIYIDGVLNKSTTGISSPTASSTAGLYIGRNDPSLSGNYFAGALDGVSIYNSALSLSSIEQLYVATH
jgi:hypothetical protein